MKSDQYWQKRLEALNEAELNKGDDYVKVQNEEYDKAMARIKKETEAWYARLSKNNDISMAEARKLLNANELKEFHWDVQEYIKRGRENAVDQRWMKQLENASAKVHITRLEELETKMQQEVELLAAKRLKDTSNVLGDIYTDGYYKGIYEVQRGVGQGIPYAKLDTKQLDMVLSKPWTPDGSNFSSRIWADKDKLTAELQKVLTQDLIRGENADKVIADFAKRMNVSKHAAERLIATESAYFSGQSRLDGYKESGVTHYKYVATLDDRTSDDCENMDGEIIPLSEAKAGVNYPPLHAFCRSTTIPHFDDDDIEVEVGERAARGKDGKTYYVPTDMTYSEWSKQYASKPIKPTEPQETVIDNLNKGTKKKVEEVFEESKDELKVIYDQVEASEEEITKAVTEIVESNKGVMEGLEFRLKEKESFERKVFVDFMNDSEFDPNLTVADVAKNINDAVRYTAIADNDQLYNLYSATIMSLVNEGHALKRVKNTWFDTNNPYNGVNVILLSPNGQSYELQFHTPDSFDLKQNRMHEYYEEYRLPTTSKERKMELWNLMLEMADGIKKPKDIDKIKG